jgi:prepilin-type N-terminal cleavage/methylation domain-containing protein
MNRDQNGFTLLEVLISIVILSIIFLSIINFFPQMSFFNKENENKTQALNNAKDLLIEWENSTDVISNLKNKTATSLPGYDRSDSTYYYFKTTKGSFNANIKIKIKSDLSSTPIETRFIDVQLLNNRNNVLGETFGYIILK